MGTESILSQPEIFRHGLLGDGVGPEHPEGELEADEDGQVNPASHVWILTLYQHKLIK